MRYAFIAAERATLPVRMLCRLIGVAASSFPSYSLGLAASRLGRLGTA
jgi:hypothetical protein